VRGDNERLCELSALAEGATSHESGYFSAMSIGRWWMATCVGLFIGGAAGAADPDGDADEPDAIVERDCLVDRPEGAETPLVAVTLSAKLQTARTRRQEAVAAARPKLMRLLEEALAKNGEATGPIADWIRRQFKQKPNYSLLVILNSSLTWGLRDAGTWVEPPAPRPDCTERKAAVAERFGTTVWLCNKFYEDGDDEAALTIYHESQHLAGVEDCRHYDLRDTGRSADVCVQL